MLAPVSDSPLPIPKRRSATVKRKKVLHVEDVMLSDFKIIVIAALFTLLFRKYGKEVYNTIICLHQCWKCNALSQIKR